MKIAHNKINISDETKNRIRSLFFRQIEMKDIEKDVGLGESVIRRLVREYNWIETRERYLRMLCTLSYLYDMSFDEIADRAKVNRYSLGRIHRKYKTPKPRMKAWNKRLDSKTEEKFIKDYSKGKSSQFIAEKYGFKTDKTVLDTLKRREIDRRPPKKVTYYKEDFFEKINSPEKAYILGLIMTDGYIIKDYSGFGIQLTEGDGYILRKISKILGSTNKVLHINCDAKRRTLPNAKDMLRLTITNKKIADDLKKMGVTRNKSKTLEYTGCVPKEYLSHFLRGLIDGDGTIGIAKNGNIWCQLTSSSRKFIDDLLSVSLPFILKLNTSKTRYFNKNRQGKTCVMYIARVSGGNEKTIEFLKWLYNNKGDLYLRRKYAKVQDQIS